MIGPVQALSFLSTKSAVTFIAVFALFCFLTLYPLLYDVFFSYAIISGENLLEDYQQV